MLFQIRFLAAIGATLLIFQLVTAPVHAANLNRLFDSGQPRELINQPVCWSPEQPDDPQNCDFAQKT
jgi:hypothetical protein